MRTLLVCLLMILGTLPARLLAEDAPPKPASAPARGTLSVEVDKSIARAMDYLRLQQKPDGSWGQEVNNIMLIILKTNPADPLKEDPEGGRTALVTLALLSAGEEKSSPVITRAMDYLSKRKPITVYSLSMRAAAYAMMGEKRREQLRADVRSLIDLGYGDGPYSGLWTYGDSSIAGTYWHGHRPDASNSQYAVLGLWYATQAGVPVSRDLWRRVEGAWVRIQNPDGGWGYYAGDASTASMTAAGLAVLFITQDFLQAQEAINLGKPYQNVPIENGLFWLAQNFSLAYNAGKDEAPDMKGRPEKGWGRWAGIRPAQNSYVHYMLYGYERVGEASGLTRFGNHIWYDEGARFLIETQSDEGSWRSINQPEEDTAFGLLFLARGRDPVPLQKLKFAGRWHNRPRDMARTIHWLRDQMERHVNWQVVDVDQPIEDYFDSPILYMASNEAVTFNDEQRAKLRRYLLEGGLILCAQEGGSRDFAKSIEEMAAGMFPSYPFRDLPPTHPLLKGNFQVKELQSDIRSVSNGVRELIVMLPNGDLPARWHSPAQAAMAGRESPYLLFGNLVPYSNGRTNPKYKGERVVHTKDTTLDPQKRVNIARIQLGSNWDPEPLAWERMAAIMWNQDRCELRYAPIVPGGPVAFGSRVKLAHLTLTDPLDTSLMQEKELRNYVKNGGTLFIDVAGGSREAGKSIEKMLERTFIGENLVPIPIDHKLYTGEGFGGNKITEVRYRRWAEERLPRTKLPRLHGVFVDGRLGVIYSNEDLTFGMTGGETDGVIGYAPESTIDLVRNIVLFAGFGNPLPKPK